MPPELEIRLTVHGPYRTAILGIHVCLSSLRNFANSNASSLNQQPNIKDGFALRYIRADRHGLKWVFRNSFAYAPK